MRDTLQLLLTLFLLVSPACGQPEHSEQDGHDHGHEHDHDEGEEGGREDEHGHDEHGHGEGGEHSDEVTLTTEAIMRYGIASEPVKRHSLLGTFVAPARVSYNAEAIAFVGTPVPGRVSEIYARLGDTVSEGKLLLSIESPEVAEVQSDFRSKRAAMHAAKSSYQRASKLFKKSQGIALSEVQKREAELKSAEAAVNAAESTLKLYGFTSPRIEAIAQTGKIESLYPIHAPIAGTVIDRNVSLGERVGPDRDSLFTLADTSTLWVIADVPEDRLNNLTAGTPARIRVAGLPDRSFAGEVILVSPAIDPATRTIAVRIAVKDEQKLLKSGMFAQAELSPLEGSESQTLAVPLEAIQTVEGKQAVFVPVEGEANTFAKRAISAGPPMGPFVPVISGLKEGERIVTAGSFILKAELGKAGAAHEH